MAKNVSYKKTCNKAFGRGFKCGYAKALSKCNTTKKNFKSKNVKSKKISSKKIDWIYL